MRMNSHKREIGVLLTIVALIAALALRTNGYFSHANLIDLFLENLPVMIIAIGMTLIILTGEIDISVGSVFAVCSVITGVSATSGLPVSVSGLIGCLVGGLCGVVNGWLVAYVRIPSIVVTLATMVALRDGLRWKTQGSWVGDLPRQFQWFGLSQKAFTTICAASVSLLVVGAALGLRYLHAGRAVVATGSNKETARITGINTRLVVFSAFMLTGFLTGIAAVFNSVRFNQIPSNSGLGLELKVIAAVAVGGAAITGGYATIAGTVLGVTLLGCVGSALTFLGISAYWEKAIQGAIILIAVAIDRLHLYRRKNAELLPN
jgi:ribose/xylose/arabinose/galactoside ABC-type transport system permease subunit